MQTVSSSTQSRRMYSINPSCVHRGTAWAKLSSVVWLGLNMKESDTHVINSKKDYVLGCLKMFWDASGIHRYSSFIAALLIEGEMVAIVV